MNARAHRAREKNRPLDWHGGNTDIQRIMIAREY
jgi:hypothetical protein